MKQLPTLFDAFFFILPTSLSREDAKKNEMAEHLLVTNEKGLNTFIAGFSMYISAWLHLKQYPGQRSQSGLLRTWLFPRPEGKLLDKGYSYIECGPDWWRDTENVIETPQFIMGGVAPDVAAWVNGLGAGNGHDLNKTERQGLDEHEHYSTLPQRNVSI